MDAPQCNCDQPAKLMLTTKEGPNKGKHFYTCPTRSCQFFQWQDASNSSKQKNTKFQNKGKTTTSLVPKCKVHDCPTSRRVVGSNTPNKGRWFFSCPRSTKEHSCFFAWEDSLNTSMYEMVNPNDNYVSKDLISFQLCSEDRIMATFSPDLHESLKKVQISNLQMESPETLSFPTSVYDEFKSKVLATHSNAKFDDIPDVIINLLKTYPKVDPIDDKNVDWTRLPKSLMQTIFPFQKQGITFGVKRDGNLLVGDEMGLGKTIQAMSIAFYYFQDWPLLIICPASLRLNWSVELEKWLTPKIHPQDINIITESRQDVDHKVNIISYELATRMEEKLLAKKFDTIVVDECHYLKNPATERYKKISCLLRQAKHSIMITGTPALSRPSELFSQLDVILSKKMEWFSKFDYAKRYCRAEETVFGMNDKGASNLAELNILLSRTVMIRRLKKDVMKDLPEKIRQEIYINVRTKDESNIKQTMSKISHLKKSDENSLNLIEKNLVQTSSSIEWIQAYQQTGIAKLPAIKEYLDDLLETGEKFIVFGHHREVLDQLEEFVKSKKISTVRIDGDTSGPNRHKNAEKFRNDPNCLVALLSIQAAGVGLTLTPCSNVIFAELTWNPGALQQAEDRVHRIGQRNCVMIRYLLGKGTLDEMMWRMVNQKKSVLSESLDGQVLVKSTKDTSTTFELDQHHLDMTQCDGPIPRVGEIQSSPNEYDLDDDFIDDSELPDDEELLRNRSTPKKMATIKEIVEPPKGLEKATSKSLIDFVYKKVELPFNVETNLTAIEPEKVIKTVEPSRKRPIDSSSEKYKVAKKSDKESNKVEYKMVDFQEPLKKNEYIPPTPKSVESRSNVNFDQLLEASLSRKPSPGAWKTISKLSVEEKRPTVYGMPYSSPFDCSPVDANKRSVTKTLESHDQAKRRLDFEPVVELFRPPTVDIPWNDELNRPTPFKKIKEWKSDDYLFN